MRTLEPLPQVDFWEQFRPSTTPQYRRDFSEVRDAPNVSPEQVCSSIFGAPTRPRVARRVADS